MGKIVKGMSKRTVILIIICLLLSTFNLNNAYADGEFDAKKFIKDIKFSNDIMDNMLKILFEPVKSVSKNEDEVQVEPEVEKWDNFVMTHYVSDCKGCIGITKSGYDVRNTIMYKDYRVIAVDPSLIKEGSLLEIDDGEVSFEAIALDIGGLIKGNKIDLLVGSKKEADKLGVKDIKVKIVREGWEDEVI